MISMNDKKYLIIISVDYIGSIIFTSCNNDGVFVNDSAALAKNNRIHKLFDINKLVTLSASQD